MFGYYRFFLAVFVLMSHLDFSLQGFNIGVASVVSFYMLAGYVVCNLLTNVFSSDKTIYARFYCERILRIYPQYLFVALLTILFAVVSGKLVYRGDIYILVKNILVIPTNYFMFNDISFFSEKEYALVPISWSLGLELQAYILLPFVVFYKKIRAGSTIISLFVFTLACFGLLHTDYYGYRLLPGVLFIFNTGVMLAIKANFPERLSIFDKYFPALLYGSAILLTIVLGVFGKIHIPHSIQVIVGILISIPVISYISSFDKKIFLDRFMGDISYGIFLSHYLAIWIVKFIFEVSQRKNPHLFAMLVFILSFLVAAGGSFSVERIFMDWRHRLAKK
jgi:peptidoglycan/LPS O-acetylase OafA/YrhL